MKMIWVLSNIPTRTLRRLEKYSEFCENNPTWFADTFPDFNQTNLAIFEKLCYLWFQFRFLCCYDEDKFKVFYERKIREVFGRWEELINLELHRAAPETFAKLYDYNVSNYVLESNTERENESQTTDTGTVRDAGSNTTTMDLTYTTNGTKTGTRTNTGTQRNTQDETTKDTGTVNVDEEITGKDKTARDVSVDNTGTSTMNYGGSDKTENTSTNSSQGSESTSNTNSSGNKHLESYLPQSITAISGKFDTHFSGEGRDIDGDGDIDMPNYQAAWYTASSKSEDRNTNDTTNSASSSNSSSGTSDSTTTYNSNDRRVDDLNTKTDDDTTFDTSRDRDTTTTNNLTKNVTGTATRTDDLSESTSDINNSTTRNAGTTNRLNDTTKTNNLLRNQNGTDNSQTNTQYDIVGRTNHNPPEVILDAMQKIIAFCPTDWFYINLQPCFLLLADDFDDDYVVEG